MTRSDLSQGRSPKEEINNTAGRNDGVDNVIRHHVSPVGVEAVELDDGLHAGDGPLSVTRLELEPDQIQTDPECGIKIVLL